MASGAIGAQLKESIASWRAEGTNGAWGGLASPDNKTKLPTHSLFVPSLAYQLAPRSRSVGLSHLFSFLQGIA